MYFYVKEYKYSNEIKVNLSDFKETVYCGGITQYYKTKQEPLDIVEFKNLERSIRRALEWCDGNTFSLESLRKINEIIINDKKVS